ncbi:hypothetical protein [Streptomyces marincola]|uniref:Integral membrane protein n=1 Tax=Streptomyces marincola TaxID=2878388 RepID=A0A1W7CXE8_9ACTN|nr:hypothetical protein [Streptomyces marincola]ARQ69387.1 hypothetical protein CAG99_11355 [Streptomyces marincola]
MSISHPQGPPGGAADDEPRPEPIRFYGVSWVDRSGGYMARRVVLTVAALLLAVLGATVLWLGYAGLDDSGTAGWLRAMVVIAFAICTAMAGLRTWIRYTRPAPENAVDESAFRSIKVVGFVGVFFAYGLRSAIEAPGERLRRADYDAALDRYRRRTERRSGHPARKGRKKGRGRRA